MIVVCDVDYQYVVVWFQYVMYFGQCCMYVVLVVCVYLVYDLVECCGVEWQLFGWFLLCVDVCEFVFVCGCVDGCEYWCGEIVCDYVVYVWCDCEVCVIGVVVQIEYCGVGCCVYCVGECLQVGVCCMNCVCQIGGGCCVEGVGDLVVVFYCLFFFLMQLVGFGVLMFDLVLCIVLWGMFVVLLVCELL